MTDQDIKQDKGNDVSNRDLEARRRLLKASAAAPLLVTLRPNAAIAETSISCEVKNSEDPGLQGVKPAYLDSVESLPDSAVREYKEATYYASKDPGYPGILVVDGNYFYEDGSEFREDINASNFSGYLSSNFRRPEQVFVWVVKYWDISEPGKPVFSSLYPPTRLDTYILSASCMNSINPGLNPDVI